MGMNNSTKKKTIIKKVTLDNKTIITMVGELRQTKVKEEFRLQYVKTTPGGTVLETCDSLVLNTFDNEPGIRKELYMGWSVCQPEDYDAYDSKLAIRGAKNRFNRPIITRNFTYLNPDQVNVLLDNEVEFVVNKYFSNHKISDVNTYSL